MLLEKVFQVINDSGLDYCIQNKYEMMPEEIPSDIDMMYKGASEKFLDDLVKKVAEETGLLITQKISQGYFEYTYVLSYRCPEERFQLQLDFYRAISRRGYLNIMPAEEMLENKRFYKCFYVPGYFDELRYMWIRRTIKKDLDEGHIEIARNLLNLNKEEYSKGLVTIFGEEVSSLIFNIIEKNDVKIFYDNFEKFNQVAKQISKKNSPLFVKLNYARFMLFTVLPKRFFHPCGISVAFLSPDGGGKSTIIENISDRVSGSFYGLRKYYFRPRYFKNLGSYNAINPTEEAKTNDNPHGKSLNNPIKSFIRFMFYNFDFQLGTLFKIRPQRIKKDLVVFDRYYYDYYVDMERYQYNLPKWMPRAFSWMIPTPNLVFILDGDAKVLYERKQELTIEELKYQTEIYKSIGNNNNSFRHIDVNRDIKTVTDDVTEQILVYMDKYTRKIMR